MRDLITRDAVGVDKSGKNEYDENYFFAKTGQKQLRQEEYEYWRARWGGTAGSEALKLNEAAYYAAPEWHFIIEASEASQLQFTDEDRRRRSEAEAERLEAVQKLADTVLVRTGHNLAPDQEILRRDGKVHDDIDVTQIEWEKVADSTGRDGYTSKQLSGFCQQLGLSHSGDKNKLREALLKWNREQGMPGPSQGKQEVRQTIKKIATALKKRSHGKQPVERQKEFAADVLRHDKKDTCKQQDLPHDLSISSDESVISDDLFDSDNIKKLRT
jgi:hypothetical protein